ncbi:MAG: EVE domain-containing protein [Candidatus Bathyarchaeia archaeon]
MFLQPLPPPKCWLFQFNPALYRWFDRISETQEPEQWLTTHYASSISKGDRVAIWAAGEKAGVYALGQTITYPTITALNPEQEKYWVDKSGISKFKEKPSVTVKYLKLMCDRPITQQQCRDDSVLSTLQVFSNPQGTNFLMTRLQWQRLLELIAQCGL